MTTDTACVVAAPNGIYVNLPMTKTSGKVRIKRRSMFSQYGEPVAPRQTPLSQSCYVEWQIGYDLFASPENTGKTSLCNQTFVNYKGESKYAYELSEIVYLARCRGILHDAAIEECFNAIKCVPDEKTFEETVRIYRENPCEKLINGMSFYEMRVCYPLFVHRFGPYEILAEIMIRERQHGVGTQGMLYVCLPITSVQFAVEPIGRCLDCKECAIWKIGSNEANLSLELFRVFGMLSPKHRHDVMSILTMLFPDILSR